MRKIIWLLSIFSIIMTQSTAFAEINMEDLVEIAVEKHSMTDNYDLSLLKKNENNEYILHKKNGLDYDECAIDISRAYKDLYNINIYSKDSIEEYNDEDLLEYFVENIVNDDTVIDVFNMYENGEMTKIFFTSEDFAFIQKYSTELENKMLAVLNFAGVEEIYDVYSVIWTSSVPYSKRSNGDIKYKNVKCDVMYFDTDIGKIVIPYNIPYNALFSLKLEKYKIYTPKEFLAEIAVAFDEIQPIDKVIQSDVFTVNNEGDEEKEIHIDYPVNEEIKSGLDNDIDMDEEKTANSETEEEKKAPVDVADGEPKTDESENEEINSESDEKPLKNWVDVKINGAEIIFADQQPLIENDRVLVPMRKIFEELGAKIDWDEETQTVTATIGEVVITLQIGKNEITKNGITTEIDAEAQLVNDRTLVPLRAVSESFGNKVTWNAETKTVEITK